MDGGSGTVAGCVAGTRIRTMRRRVSSRGLLLSLPYLYYIHVS